MASGPTDDEPKQGAGPSDDSMGALIGLIGLVLLFFAIFFFLGFNEAKKQQRQPGAIARFVIFHTRLVHIGDTNHLVYGDAEWMLDLKTNKVKLGDPVRQQLAMLGSANPKIIAVDSSFLQIFFGSAPAALTLPDLVTMVKKGRGDYRKIIAQIVGAGTGFFAGCWVANCFFPLKHDDPAIMKWLLSSRDHSEIKKLFLSELSKNRKETAKKSAQQTIDSDSAEKLRAYKLEERLGNPEYVPTNEDFSVFVEVR
jgi:hypothetical protein